VVGMEGVAVTEEAVFVEAAGTTTTEVEVAVMEVGEVTETQCRTWALA